MLRSKDVNFLDFDIKVSVKMHLRDEINFYANSFDVNKNLEHVCGKNAITIYCPLV